MKLEDYSKYYIQGSDHYLIPKDIFVELFNEMINWKQENEELKKQLEEANKKLYLCTPEIPQNVHGEYVSYVDLVNEIYELKKQLEELREETIIDTLDLQTHEYQQQEFIKYLEDFISKTDYEVNIIGNYLYFAWSNAYKKVLQKYEEIIGGNKDENNSI